MRLIRQKMPWRACSVPPRLTTGYAPYLARLLFPDAPQPPPAPRADRHLRHWLRAGATQAHLDRFPVR